MACKLKFLLIFNLVDGCYHDQDTDGATSTEISINDMLVILTVFANGI